MKAQKILGFDSRYRCTLLRETRDVPDSEGDAAIALPQAYLDAVAQAAEPGLPQVHLILAEIGLASDPAATPETDKIREWLNAHGKDQKELDVIFFLAAIARVEWGSLPKLTPAEHQQKFDRIARLCRSLARELEQTGADYQRGGGHGLDHACVGHLLTQQEADLIDGAAILELPTMNDLLTRLGSAAERIGSRGPIHPQPRKRGAERGYFVRRMGGLFQRRYSEQPCEVIAILATIALGEATDRELVAKLLA